MSMGFPPAPKPPPPVDLATQETTLRNLMVSLVNAYNTGQITSPQFHSQHDHIAARLYDVKKAQAAEQGRLLRATMQQQMQQQMLAQQQIMHSMTPLQMLSGLAGGLTDMTPRAPLETEDAFGEVVGWRCWLSPALPVLTSCYVTNYIWMPRAVEEAKHVEDYNQLGFHAWRDERQALGYAIGLGPVVIVGRVKLWGDVIHHEKGFRAQFAKIESLDTLITYHAEASERRSMGTLRRHYGVDHGKADRH
jgi:hypothetical protein